MNATPPLDATTRTGRPVLATLSVLAAGVAYAGGGAWFLVSVLLRDDHDHMVTVFFVTELVAAVALPLDAFAVVGGIIAIALSRNATGAGRAGLTRAIAAVVAGVLGLVGVAFLGLWGLLFFPAVVH